MVIFLLTVPHGTKQNFQKGEIAMISTKNVIFNLYDIVSKRCNDDIFLIATVLNELSFMVGYEDKILKCNNLEDIKFSYDETCKLADC